MAVPLNAYSSIVQMYMYVHLYFRTLFLPGGGGGGGAKLSCAGGGGRGGRGGTSPTEDEGGGGSTGGACCILGPAETSEKETAKRERGREVGSEAAAEGRTTEVHVVYSADSSRTLNMYTYIYRKHVTMARAKEKAFPRKR